MQTKYKKLIISLVIIMSFGSVSANAKAFVNTYSSSTNLSQQDINTDINSAYELLEFQDRMANSSIKSREELISKSLKLKSMAEYAKSVAIRAGIQSRLKNIRHIIESNSRELDAIYDFNPLMIQQNVIPPVISEANNLYNQSGTTQVNRAKKIFKIEQQARFATTAPNWRSYLTFPVESNAFERYAYMSGELKPKDEIELKVWQDATVEGWNLGVQQANNILKQSLARLNRDYLGMVRFHEFVMQGKVSMPVINQYDLHNTNNGLKMVIDENLLRITVLPTFNNQNNIISLPQHRLRENEIAIINEDGVLNEPTALGETINMNEDAEVKVDEVVADSVQNILNDDGQLPKISSINSSLPKQPPRAKVIAKVVDNTNTEQSNISNDTNDIEYQWLDDDRRFKSPSQDINNDDIEQENEDSIAKIINQKNPQNNFVGFVEQEHNPKVINQSSERLSKNNQVDLNANNRPSVKFNQEQPNIVADNSSIVFDDDMTTTDVEFDFSSNSINQNTDEIDAVITSKKLLNSSDPNETLRVEVKRYYKNIDTGEMVALAVNEGE